VLRALARGWQGRCPRCGEGEVFSRWIAVRPSCSACALELPSNPGDTWGFWVLGDRIFIVAAVAAIYLGVTPSTVAGRVALMSGLIIVLIATIRQRMGVCVAIDYLLRRRVGRSRS
jgi:uncharacterized protein (DUF983 family)